MDHTVEIYEAEKELREKRLAAYAEAIQKKVQRGFRADNKRTCRREIPSKEDTTGDGRYNRSEVI